MPRGQYTLAAFPPSALCAIMKLRKLEQGGPVKGSLLVGFVQARANGFTTGVIDGVSSLESPSKGSLSENLS